MERLLRKCEVCENVVMAFRLQHLHVMKKFVALDMDEASFRQTCKPAFNVDLSITWKHKQELTKLAEAWKTDRVQTETKTKVEAVNMARTKPSVMLDADWTLLLRSTMEELRNQVYSDDEHVVARSNAATGSSILSGLYQRHEWRLL